MHSRAGRKTWKVIGVFPVFCVVIFIAACANREKVALLMANSEYREGWPSLNDVPTNDVKALRETLSDIGFDVTTMLNLNEGEMQETITSFHNSFTSKDIVLVYYSGHGVRVGNDTFFVPVDTPKSLARFKGGRRANERVMKLSEVVNYLELVRSDNILIFDACRDNGLEQVGDPRADPIDATYTTVAFAAKAGKTASIKPTARGTSPYTDALIEELKIPGLTVEKILDGVARRLANESDPFASAPYYTKTGPLDEVLHELSPPAELIPH